MARAPRAARPSAPCPPATVGYEKLYNASLAAASGGEDAFVDAILSGQPEPQMYFARMKRDNRDGVPLLGPLPQPPHLTVREFGQKVRDGPRSSSTPASTAPASWRSTSRARSTPR